MAKRKKQFYNVRHQVDGGNFSVAPADSLPRLLVAAAVPDVRRRPVAGGDDGRVGRARQAERLAPIFDFLICRLFGLVPGLGVGRSNDGRRLDDVAFGVELFDLRDDRRRRFRSRRRRHRR